MVGAKKGEAELEVQSSCCSGSVGQGHAARAHMESRLKSSADSNCPSVVSIEQHVSRSGRLAARCQVSITILNCSVEEGSSA